MAARFAANGRKRVSCRIQATKDMFPRAARLLVDFPCKKYEG